MENKKIEKVEFDGQPFVYRGYAATISYNRMENNFYGEVNGISGVIVFSGSSIDELEREFINSVDEYLAECEKEDRKPDKQYSGDILIQLHPNLHCRLALVCEELGADLHEFVENTLFHALEGAELSLMSRNTMDEMNGGENFKIESPWFNLDAYDYPLLYKGYGAVMYKDDESDDENMLFEGYLLGGKPEDDLYCFNGGTIDEAIANFRKCVDDVIEQNKKDGIDEKPHFDGNMMLKIDPRVQYLLALFANCRAMSEEDYIIDSLYDSFQYERVECEICEPEIMKNIIVSKGE